MSNSVILDASILCVYNTTALFLLTLHFQLWLFLRRLDELATRAFPLVPSVYIVKMARIIWLYACEAYIVNIRLSNVGQLKELLTLEQLS